MEAVSGEIDSILYVAANLRYCHSVLLPVTVLLLLLCSLDM